MAYGQQVPVLVFTVLKNLNALPAHLAERDIANSEPGMYIMKQQVKVNNTVYQVDYERSSGCIQVTIDDRRYLIDAAAVSGGFYSLLLNGQSHDIWLDGRDDHFAVQVDGTPFEVDFYDPRNRRRNDDDIRRFAAQTQQVICAPMAGRIVRFQVETGDMVADGDGLIVLEAMKMENELKSQGIGRVKKILAAVDDVVTPGQQLMVIE